MGTAIVALVALFAVAAVNAGTAEYKEKWLKEVHDTGVKCVGEVGALQADFDGLIAHKIPDSHEGKCLIFCIYKKYNVQNDDGSINLEGALTSLEKMKDLDPQLFDQMLKVATICAKKDFLGDDGCVTAANIHSCGIEEGKKLGISTDIFEL